MFCSIYYNVINLYIFCIYYYSILIVCFFSFAVFEGRGGGAEGGSWLVIQLLLGGQISKTRSEQPQFEFCYMIMQSFE